MAIAFDNLYINENGFVFDHRTGLTYTVNHTGIFLLRQLLEGMPRAEIIHALGEKYDINHQTATGDFDDFLQQLVNFNLLDKPSEA